MADTAIQLKVAEANPRDMGCGSIARVDPQVWAKLGIEPFFSWRGRKQPSQVFHSILAFLTSMLMCLMKINIKLDFAEKATSLKCFAAIMPFTRNTLERFFVSISDSDFFDCHLSH